MFSRPGRFSIAGLLLAVAGCGGPAQVLPAPPDPAWFEDATDRLGIAFVHDPGPAGDYLMPRAMGSGCALFDADGDGRLDILLLQNGGPAGPPNHLFLQQPDGRFRDASAGSGLDFPGHNMGVAVGDANGDGRPDVLITQYRGARLLLNRGGGRFEDVTAAAGIDNPSWGTSAAFVDYDRDGRLDLIIVNYVDVDPGHACSDATGRREFCPPTSFPGTSARLFRNLGVRDGVPRFEDVSVRSGIAALPGPGLGVYVADLTGDGWPDLFVANDEKPNRLWVNQKDGTFKDEAVGRGLAFDEMGRAAGNMGIAAGDVDGDGLIDLFVTHLTTESHTLWRQGPRGTFTDRTRQSGVGGTRWRGTGFGTLVCDFDRDGRPDLALVNGRIARGGTLAPDGLAEFWRPYAERNQVLRNTGGGRFEDASDANPAFCGVGNVGRGLAWGDIDGDGRPDLLVTTVAGPARVLLNRSADGHHWVGVRPVLADGRDAHGAEVRVRAGGATQVRLADPTASYLSSSSPEALVGLGERADYDGIEVMWPDGSREAFPAGPADRRVTLRQRAGTPGPGQ
jgi:hypothetical protein